jgi:hypothetical protein
MMRLILFHNISLLATTVCIAEGVSISAPLPLLLITATLIVLPYSLKICN